MRTPHILPVAVLSFAAVLNAQTLEERLKWASDAIDTHAMTHHFDPPAKSSETKWQVTRIDGCTVELTETLHRESPDSVITGEGVFGVSEDKVIAWTFDLANLLPQFVVATTSGGPHLELFAEGDTFHSKTDVVSRVVRNDGSTVSSNNWSAPGAAANLWIYFDSSAPDNSSIVRKLELDLKGAVDRCTARRNKAAHHHRW